MAREPATKDDSVESEEDTCENRPSDLDDLTHQELRLMYNRPLTGQILLVLRGR
ncbi:MAG: hypothetical protein VX340_12730 [Pseudomonadota bacterium]|nr:hypothetical protein [Pseudomonadota bacterium]